MVDGGQDQRPGWMTPERLPRLAGRVFQVVGVFIAVIGVIVVSDDPAGFALILFGAVFVGLGTLVSRKLAAPPGQKAVVITDDSFDTAYGARANRGRIVHVDEDASEDEIRAAIKAETREQLADRPDWVAGEIVAEEARLGGLLRMAVGAWVVFSMLAGGAGLIWGSWAWLVAGGSAVLALGLIARLAMSEIRRRKFGAAQFVPVVVPIPLGATLRGRLRSGIAAKGTEAPTFELRLQCIRRYETSRPSSGGSGSTTTTHTDTLWEHEVSVPGARASGAPDWQVDVRIPLPDDQPAATLIDSGKGIFWDLRVKASVPGIDYLATFRLPVVGAVREERVASS